MYLQASVDEREFLDEFAKSLQFDPLVAKNWYVITRSDIVEVGGYFILSRHNNSHIDGIIQLYPELQFDRERFISKDGWRSPDTQMNFFDNLARSIGFDPLEADKWYHITKRDIINAGGSPLLDLHNKSHIDAITRHFPELHLDRERFLPKAEISPESHRWFLDNLARSKGIEPLEAKGWSLITRRDIINAGGYVLLYHHSNSHVEAIIHHYPELHLRRENLIANESWKSMKKVREFFDNFAKFKKFDPLNVKNWYPIKKFHIRKVQGGTRMFNKHKGSLIKLLKKVYPEVEFDETQVIKSRTAWRNTFLQRKFFDEFAKTKNFDPLDPKMWHIVLPKDIIKLGGRSLLCYSGSHIEALRAAYPELHLQRRDFVMDKEFGISYDQKNFEDIQHLVTLKGGLYE